MTTPIGGRTPRRLPIATGAAMVVLAGLLALSYLRFQAPPDTAPTTPGSTTPAPAASTGPAPSVRCSRETGPLPAMLSADPCPDAVVAVERAVVDVGPPMERIVIEPGPFFCDVIWPGVQTAPACFGQTIRPGQFMHAWVTFRETDRVAAVMLGLNLPDDLDQPGATRPPWRTTLVAVEAPPDGWVVP